MPKRSKKPELERLLEFHRFILEFQKIKRHICYLDNGLTQSENDAEHSYSLAMTAWFISTHFPKLDTDKVIRLALAHDLIEVHSGDTSVFSSSEILDTKDARELAALDRLTDEWTDFPEMTEAIREYKNKSSEEAKFVYALDKIMPIILNIINDGLGWKVHGISLEQVHATKKDRVTSHPEINEYYLQIYEFLVSNPKFFKAKENSKKS